ncbi:DNA-binding transcriptional regulator [Commensalibacter communis]|uniref:MocR family n=1 Tax=Commensalibacter communis TaxID=2972786 RepID=A0A9W4X6Y8_9PROT|nr:PLP-dependent aminotransferase family protein [Commensalibacter communis]CAI3943074.1 DNA-binding transcriptional regulator [Commensalibacter communis]CAI3951492.1 DNA-binding transcriptional regulator [Commensalibacter communis]CAI3953090.1 DNA-binding transcriptional regulator [Commensalibacter communis]CAI3960341.1 DNA-binding transcriptional regulator [Commensalibacter communis]
MWHLPVSSTHPLYKQVIDLIEQAIVNGQLSPGEQLPSERKMSVLLQVNRSTIIHALNELTDRGVIIRKIGSGSFVNPDKWGLQTHPLMNWQPLKSAYTQFPKDDYVLQVQHLRKECIEQQKSIQDMATGDLSPNLLPDLNLTNLPIKDLLSLEQDDETAQLGLYSFRQAVQNHMHKRLGLKVDLSEILITTGTQQALFLISQTLLKPGDRIGVEAPSSFYRLPIFQAAGLRICALPMDENGVTLQGLKALVQKHPIKMVFLNPLFQNPTGSCMDQKRKQQILEYCHHYQIPLIEDDACSMLSFSSNVNITPIKAFDTHQQVIYMGSLSKYMGKNIRAGWVIAPKSIIAQLAHIRQQIDGGLSVLPQLLAEHYLRHQQDQHCSHLQQQLALKAKLLCEWLQTNHHNDLSFTPPQGGLYCYAKFHEDKLKKIPKILQSWLTQKITIAKGEEFGGKAGEIRFNFSQF